MPKGRYNVILDDATLELLGIMSRATGANRSELIRRGAWAHWNSLRRLIDITASDRRRIEKLEEKS